MKQLTMTKVLTPLAALALAFGVQAATVSDGFETDTSTVVTNLTGWSFVCGTDGADDASAITAYPDAASKPASLPDAFATAGAGDNYLKLSTEDGTLFRSFDDASTILDSGLYVDTDVQFTVTQTDDRPQYSAGDKFIIWLEENSGSTNLCVMAREYSYESSTIGVSGNKVYTLANTSDIVPGQWYRLTVKAIKNANAGGSYAFPGFQIYLNNVLLAATDYAVAYGGDDEVLTGFLGATGAAGALFSAKTFFPAMTVDANTALSTLSKVGFSGEGAVDNVALTQDIPGFAPSVRAVLTLPAEVTSINIPALGVTGAANGDTITIAPGASFTLANNNITMASGNVADYNFSWTNLSRVTADGLTITANSVETAVAGALTLTATALNTVDVTLDYSDIDTEVLRGIAYSVNGGEPVEIDIFEFDERVGIDNCGFGTNIAITVTLNGDSVAQFTPTAGLVMNDNIATVVSRPSGGKATITITAVDPAAKVNGTSYATFAEAVAAAKNTANAVELADDVTLTDTEAVSLAAGDTLVVDLKGCTITGAAGYPVFSNAGTLTITDTEETAGSVVAGSEGTVVANTGTLSLVKGTYTGTFTNSGTFTITTDCVFSYDLDGAYTPATGYQVAETGTDTGVYKLGLITYSITYKKGDAEITPAPGPTTYTVVDNVTLPSATPDTGYTFTGWKDANGDDVTSWTAGQKNGNLVLTAQFSKNSYNVTVTGGANATAAWTVNGSSVAAPTTLAYGDTYSVTYTANAGYKFADGATTTASGTVADNISITISDAVAITVEVTVTGGANATAAWTVNGSSVVAAPTTLAYGDTYSVTYTANSGYKFADGATTTASGTAGAEDIEITISDAIVDTPETPTVDPTDPTTPVEVEAASADAAIEKVAIATPVGVDAADYKALFDFSATPKAGGSGTYEVTVTGIKETVEQAVATTAAAIVSGTAASGTVTVPAGLYYEITTMESLGGAATVRGRNISNGTGVTVAKPGTTQGFIKVKIGTTPFGAVVEE